MKQGKLQFIDQKMRAVSKKRYSPLFSVACVKESFVPVGLLDAGILGEQALAQADGFGRNLDQLVVADELDALLQAHQGGGRKA